MQGQQLAPEAVPVNATGNVDNAPRYPMRSVTIQPMDRGYMVSVGCKALAFTDLKEMMDLVNQFFNDPAGTEDRFYAGKLFAAQ